MNLIRDFLRFGFAPVFFAGAVGISIWVVEAGFSKLWLLVLLLFAISIALVAERIAPFEAGWNISKGDTLRDIQHAIVNELFVTGSIVALPVLSTLTGGFQSWPDEWPIVAQLLLAGLVADFGITMVHYASHKVATLWRLHAVHHSVRRLYCFNGLMKHPLHQALELAVGTSPLLFLGMPLEIGLLLAFAASIQLLLQHSNLDMRVGPLIYIWAVAPAHRHHHRADEAIGDVNFGFFTMIWDHLLGTFSIDRPQPRDGDLGIANRLDYPLNYYDQLFEPFRKVR